MLGERAVDAVFIGGSAGMLDVLRTILPSFADAPAVPIVVVIHLPERAATVLPQVLPPVRNRVMKFAEDKEPVANGAVYFAPPGYHLLVEPHHCFALSADPPVLFSRPSIDVLFESAAQAYADRLLGILLTGASADGAVGMQAIHAVGGITIVQAPHSAQAAAMPNAAIARFAPTYVLAPADIATVLASLSVRSDAAAGGADA
jgi:two-component system chemotaxis response regulator CheB